LKGAEVQYQLAVEVNPSNADAVGSYASFMHGVLGKMDKAESLYEDAIRVSNLFGINFALFYSFV